MCITMCACSEQSPFTGSWRMDIEKMAEDGSQGQLEQYYASLGWIELILDVDHGVYSRYSPSSVTHEVLDIHKIGSNFIECTLRRTSGDMRGTFRLTDDNSMTFIHDADKPLAAYYVRSPFAENLRIIEGNWHMTAPSAMPAGRTQEEEARIRHEQENTRINFDMERLVVTLTRPGGVNRHSLYILTTQGQRLDVHFGNVNAHIIIKDEKNMELHMPDMCLFLGKS